MRIALLADIHGNWPALQAVVTELERLQPDLVVVDGDLINGTPFSPAVVDYVQQQRWTVVRGNHEFYFLDFGTERAILGSEDERRWGQLHWLTKQLTHEHAVYLGQLPDECTLYMPGQQPLFVTHGVPGQNRVGFHDQTPDSQIAQELAGLTVPTLITAHTHVQLDRQVKPSPGHPLAQRGWHVINPGSVGMPLNGDPRAQFAMVEGVPESTETGGWSVTFYRVPYDRRLTLAAFRESGMAAAGGVIAQLFYWQIVSAELEVSLFFEWARQAGLDPELAIDETFAVYQAATGRDEYIRAQNPLGNQALA
jgi:predicted phosphodiesterase